MSTISEAYVHLSAGKTTLTFYYDSLRAYRYGTTWGIEEKEKKKNRNSSSHAWTSTCLSPNTTVLTAVFDASFRDFHPTTTAGWFCYFSSLRSIEGFEHLNTSQVTDMSGMFSGCESLISLDLSRFDTSKVTDMGGMFSSCWSLTALDLSRFDTSKVTTMGGMFNSCWSLTALDLSSFDTSHVTYMRSMFYRCYSLTALDLSSFDTSKVKNMGEMFEGCESLTALDLSSFDTSHVTYMEEMFYRCYSLTALDLSRFDTSKVTNMEKMFYGCESLTSLDLSSFDTSQVKYMRMMFFACSSLISLDLSRFDTSKVTNMMDMFRGCSSLTSLDLSSFDTSHVTGMYRMFGECSSLTALDLSSFDTSQVTSMSSMFYDCSSLTTIYSNSLWSCRNSNDMFSGCNSLRGAATNVGKSFDVSMANPERGYFTKKVLSQEDEAYVHLSADKKTLTFYFDRERNVRMRCYAWSIETSIRENDQRTPEWLSSEVTSKEEITQIIIDESFRNVVPKTTASWFEGLSAVTEIRGLDNLNTSEVTDMSCMFAGCRGLRLLDVSSFDTSHVTDMHAMFKNCKSLTTLDLSNFQTSEVKNMGEMFSGCSTLTTILSFAFRNCFASEAMFYECSSLQGAANFNEKYTDARMANPERGYFTKKVL